MQLIIKFKKKSNSNKIFNFEDEKGDNISESKYYEEDKDLLNDEKHNQYKFILLANQKIIANLKNNQIIEYFFDCHANVFHLRNQK